MPRINLLPVISTILLSKFSALLSTWSLGLLAVFCANLSAQQPPKLVIAAAADLAPLEKDLSESFAKTTRWGPTWTFAASGMLARQIEHGAPYDVYLSANEAFVKQLAAGGQLVPGSVRVYALGRLGIWSRSGRYRRLEDLADPGIRTLAIANPLHAPYGLAAQEALRNKHLWEPLRTRLVYGENVQQAFQFAETGNADAVITAWSIVRTRGGELIPSALYSPIRQTGAIVKGSPHQDGAVRFLEFLIGPVGRQILSRGGFLSPP